MVNQHDSTNQQSALSDFTAEHRNRKVLVTGATGYVGGRLVPDLLSAGFSVRAASRKKSSLNRFDWADDVEKVEADLTDASSLTEACEGIDTVFYLVHSMGSKGEDFEEAEKKAAQNLADACEQAGVRQIIYLSGLFPTHLKREELSKHMRSRENVAQILLDSPTPTIVYRAATLIGSGSASYEIIRNLSERLPIMIAPQWINNKIEPIAIRDALYYLVKGADLNEPVNRGFEIGCGKQYKFADLLRLYGRSRGHRRVVKGLPLRGAFDGLSGAWISLVTPVPFSIAYPLAQSMAEDSVCEEHEIAEYIPDPPGGLVSYERALELAAERELNGEVTTSWDDSWSTVDDNPANPSDSDPDWAQPDSYQDVRTLESELSAEQVWPVIESIGGESGWYSASFLWNLRGLMDKAVGGPGLGGRRDARTLKVGDRLDWWRVESIDRPHQLVLRAEMKVSGRAWLVLELKDKDGGGCTYKQTAVFLPQGIRGRLYWYGVLPFHAFIFPTMARRILATAASRAH